MCSNDKLSVDAFVMVQVALTLTMLPFTSHFFMPYRMVEQDSHRGALQQAIITSIRARVRGDENRIKSPCLGVAWAKDRQSLLGYAFGNARNFLQIYLAMPSLLPKVKRIFVWWRTWRLLPVRNDHPPPCGCPFQSGFRDFTYIYL